MKLTNLLLSTLLLSFSHAATFTTSFDYDDGDPLNNTDNGGNGDRFNLGANTLEFIYTVDAAGSISLDAQTSNPTAAVVTAIDTYDSPNFTTTSDASLFGSSFTLALTATKSFAAGLVNANLVIGELSDIGVAGGNQNFIDQGGTGPGGPGTAIETFTLTLSSTNPNLTLSFDDFGFSATGDAVDFDITSSTTTGAESFTDAGTAGVRNVALSGYTLQDGDTFTINAVAGGGGVGLQSLEFTLAPEPTSSAFLGLGVLLLVGRRKR